MKNQLRKTKNNKTNSPLMLIFSAFVLQVIFFLAACILALSFDIERDNYYIFSVAAFAVGSIASGFVTARVLKKNGMLYGTLFALPSNLLCILLSAVLNKFSVDYNLLLSFALLIVCSAAGGVISVNLRPKKIIVPHKIRK